LRAEQRLRHRHCRSHEHACLAGCTSDDRVDASCGVLPAEDTGVFLKPGTAALDEGSARPYRPYGFAAAMGVLAYFLTFNLSFCLGTGAYWEQASGDVSVHLAGLRYFQAEPWQFPLFDVQTLGYTQGTNIIFTDSIPLLGAVAKVLSGLIGSINYLGFWFF